MTAVGQDDLFPITEEDGVLLSEAAVAVPREHWPKSLADMLDVATAALERAGIAPDLAGEYSRRVLLAIAQFHGGLSWYLPAGDDIERALRDDAIFRASGRMSMTEIARRHKISLQRVYQIVAEQMALRRKAIQPDLF
ncbi:MAG TPA: Mor transcription activator family protein [Rhodocyclaceae bacterium]|nr:Mor transcription activator family protein [Rhodocyclaceae bacterium]